MRFTRGAKYKERQWGQLAELQIGAVDLRRWILMEENGQEAFEGARGTNNARLLNQIEERWEVDRTENAETRKKPLLDYEEWAAIDRAVGREVGDRNGKGGQEKEGEMSRWETWGPKKISERWKWLTELGFYPRRRPVRNSTEEMGKSQTGGERDSPPGADVEGGITEIDMEMMDREKDPELTEKERIRLKTCE